MVPDPDSPVWYYATMFSGIWTVVFGVALGVATSLLLSNIPLVMENAFLFAIFGTLEVVSTATFGLQ